MKKSAYFLFILLMSGSLFISHCDDDSLLWDATSKRYTWFTIVSTSPAKSAVNVPSNAAISIEFSQSMNTASFNGSFRLDSDFGAVSISEYNVAWSNNNTIVTLTPIATSDPYPLKNTVYNLVLNNANLRSVDGNPMESAFSYPFASLSFSDSIKPKITKTCVKSTSGDICEPAGTIDGSIIFPVDSIEFTFDEPMVPNSLESAFSFTTNGNSRTHSGFTYSPDQKTFTFTLSNIPSSTFAFSIDNTALDSAGNPLDSTSVITNKTFTVGGGNYVDYMITNTNFPSSGIPSNAFTGDFKIANAGQINGTQPVSYSVYLGTSSTDLSNQIANGNLPGPLNSLQTSSIINFGGTWSVTPGTYYLIVIVTAVDEGTSTGNNTYNKAVPSGAPLLIIPNTTTLVVTQTKQFTGQDGFPPYTYAVTSGSGTIDASGLFTAPTSAGTSTVTVTDSTFASANATVTITRVTINPISISVGAGLTTTFTASGGVAPYTYSMVSGSGNIGSSTGVYTASMTIGTETIRVTDALGFTSDALVTVTDNPPTPGSSGTITTSSIHYQSFTLNWTMGTDDFDPQSALTYKVYYSPTNNIGSVAGAESNGILVGSETANINTKMITTGLTPNTTYYFNVVVKDTNLNKSAYTMMTAVPDAPHIFVTNSIPNGALGGIAGADSICNTDTARNTAYTYKALIVGGGRSTSVDWPMKPNTKYYRIDLSTVIGTTNVSGIFPLPLTNSVRVAGGGVWTGSSGVTWAVGNTCNNWTDGLSATGVQGSVSLTTSSYGTSSIPFCINGGALYCVSQ